MCSFAEGSIYNKVEECFIIPAINKLYRLKSLANIEPNVFEFEPIQEGYFNRVESFEELFSGEYEILMCFNGNAGALIED